MDREETQPSGPAVTQHRAEAFAALDKGLSERVAMR